MGLFFNRPVESTNYYQELIADKDREIEDLKEQVKSLEMTSKTYNDSIKLARHESRCKDIKFNLADKLREKNLDEALRVRDNIIKECVKQASLGQDSLEYEYWGPYTDEEEYHIIQTVAKFQKYFVSYFREQGIRLTILLDPHFNDATGVLLSWKL